MNSMGKLMNQNILMKNTNKSHARLIRRRNAKPWFQYLSPSKHKRFSSPTVVTGIDNVPPEIEFQIDIAKLFKLFFKPTISSFYILKEFLKTENRDHKKSHEVHEDGRASLVCTEKNALWNYIRIERTKKWKTPCKHSERN